MSESIDVTLILDEREGGQIHDHALAVSDPEGPRYGQHVGRAGLLADWVYLPDAERQQVVDWLAGHGIRPLPHQPNNRQVLIVEGTPSQVAAAFGDRFLRWLDDVRADAAPRIEWHLPRGLAGYVQAAYGQAGRNKARCSSVASFDEGRAHLPHAIDGRARPADLAGLAPDRVRRIYEFPDDAGPAPPPGAGQTIALMKLGGALDPADCEAFWEANEVSREMFEEVEVGRQTARTTTPGEQLEATMTVQWLGAMAPGARIVVYSIDPSVVPDPWAAFLRAVIADEANAPTIACTSWITPERQYYRAHGPGIISALLDQCAAIGVTVISAAGDWGTFDGVPRRRWKNRYGIREYVSDAPWPHGVFPAVEAGVLGVGGTMITRLDPLTELAWSGPLPPGLGQEIHFDRLATSGGFSEEVPLPSWQSSVVEDRSFSRGMGRPAVLPYGRGFPDVAFMASGPAVLRTGDASLTAVSFQAHVGGAWIDYAGGTSLGAPIWAAIIARANQARAERELPPLGFVNPRLYALDEARRGACFRDVALGNSDISVRVVNNEGNLVSVRLAGFEAADTWDPCTGLGVPRVEALISALAEG